MTGLVIGLISITVMALYTWSVILVYKRHLDAQKDDAEAFGEDNDDERN